MVIVKAGVHVKAPATSDRVKVEEDRAQLTCFGETLNLSKANVEAQLMRRVQIPHGEALGGHAMSQAFSTPSAGESAALPQFSFRYFLFLEFIN